METVLAYFGQMPPAVRTAVLAGGLLFFWILEGLIPLLEFQYRKWKHAGLNILLTVFQLLVALSFALLIVRVSSFTTEHQFGVLHLLPLPLWLHVILGVLLLDLIGAWLIHWLGHHVKWMWKFHLVHHTDQQIDVTTGLRHHPGETVLRMSFTLLAVLVAGVPMGVVFLYQTLSIFFAHLTHANFRTPKGLDWMLARVVVTPRFHRVHHHYRQPWTDSNYGNIFSIWDRLFGTAHDVDSDRLVFGIDTHMEPEECEHLGNLLQLPFQTYRAPQGSKFSGSPSDEPSRD